MKPYFLTKSTAAFVLAAITAILTPSAYAQNVNVTFDELSVPPGTALEGAPVTDYLAGYGITLSGMLPGHSARVNNTTGTGSLVVPSAPNWFLVGGLERSLHLHWILQA